MAELNHTRPRDNPAGGHEQSDVSIRLILAFGIGLIVLAIVIHVALYWLLEYYKSRSEGREPAVSAISAEEQIPPPPRLQVSPQTDLARLRAAEEKELQTYRWVDEKKKIVKIPIDRAMELLVERGLPARRQPLTPPSPSGRGLGRGNLQEEERKGIQR